MVGSTSMIGSEVKRSIWNQKIIKYGAIRNDQDSSNFLSILKRSILSSSYEAFGFVFWALVAKISEVHAVVAAIAGKNDSKISLFLSLI